MSKKYKRQEILKVLVAIFVILGYIIILPTLTFIARLIFSFFIDTSYQYVNRAETYIEEKYDGMKIMHILVRGDENGYASAGYYYTHFATVNEPIVEFMVGEPIENQDTEIGDNYELALLELEMKKRATDHFKNYIDGDFYMEAEVDKRSDYTTLSIDEFMDLSKFIELSRDIETYGWSSSVHVIFDYEGVKEISAEEMLAICKELSDSELLGIAPMIRIQVDNFVYLKDEDRNETQEVNVDELSLGSGTTYPNERYQHNSPEEEFLEEYNFYMERSAN